MRALHWLCVTLALGAALAVQACGSEDGGGSPSSGNTSSGSATGAGGGTGGTSSAGGAGGCGDIGTPCSGSCPGGLTCIEEGQSGFCIPPSSECGGFAGARCPDSVPVCMTLSGADFGPCGTEQVKACVCANAPGALADC